MSTFAFTHNSELNFEAQEPKNEHFLRLFEQNKENLAQNVSKYEALNPKTNHKGQLSF
jgi:hypothetical protein